MFLKKIFLVITKKFTSPVIKKICIQILINFITFIYILVQLYKVLCYSKITFDWFPLLNPYHWPFFLFKKSTHFYFYFWSKLIPKIKLYIFTRDLSHFIAIDALTILLFILQTLYTLLLNIY